MVVVDGRAHIRYQNICYYCDDVGWSACFRNALINVMIININKCLFYYYLYIVFNTSTPIEWGNEYKKTWHRYFDTKIFFIYAFMILCVYIAIQQPLLTLLKHGCWPVGLVPVWLRETCNNPDDVRLSTRFRNVLISVMMMIIIILITNFLYTMPGIFILLPTFVTRQYDDFIKTHAWSRVQSVVFLLKHDIDFM